MSEQHFADANYNCQATCLTSRSPSILSSLLRAKQLSKVIKLNFDNLWGTAKTEIPLAKPAKQVHADQKLSHVTLGENRMEMLFDPLSPSTIRSSSKKLHQGHSGDHPSHWIDYRHSGPTFGG
jgi:hypothetical protein